MDLKKVSTQRLLMQLKILRSKIVQPWRHYHDEQDLEQYEVDKAHLDKLKAELATREHYPSGAEGRKLRQKDKQNR